MRITGIHTSVEDFQLARPYTIAFRSVDDVQMSFVRLNTDDGLTGIGCASPESMVTGETREACSAALEEDALSWLQGRDPRTLPALCIPYTRHTCATADPIDPDPPAALVDIALPAGTANRCTYEGTIASVHVTVPRAMSAMPRRPSTSITADRCHGPPLPLPLAMGVPRASAASSIQRHARSRWSRRRETAAISIRSHGSGSVLRHAQSGSIMCRRMAAPMRAADACAVVIIISCSGFT